jgi:DNA-binding response OmpR family regulator
MSEEAQPSRILIVDQDEHVRDRVSELVESMGHYGVPVSDLVRAVGMLKRVEVDLVLLEPEIPRDVQEDGVGSVARVTYGKKLLESIVAWEPGPPPHVIVVTSHGIEGYQFAVDMMEMGAAYFIGKPFEEEFLQEKIERILSKERRRPLTARQQGGKFGGGTLVVSEVGVEFEGAIIGGSRGHGYIQKIIRILMAKEEGIYVAVSRKELAKSIAGEVGKAEDRNITSAVIGFRMQSRMKLKKEKGLMCGEHDIIETVRGRGYRLASHIEVKLA